MSSLSTLLVLADGRLPAGGHAHSGGVEAAVAAGRVHDLPSLRSFLVGRTATAGAVAAAFAAAACHAVAANGDPEPARPVAADTARIASRPRQPGAIGSVGRLSALDDGIDARTASPALRAASRAQGRALLRAAARIWPGTPATEGQPHHPIAVGITAAGAGLGPREAALVAVYGGLTGAASAAVRLLGLDPYAVHALIADLAPDCDRSAATAPGRTAYCRPAGSCCLPTPST
ncbi:urease accessory UreF family protein [Asanoa sp. NPDC050611]|uniref:urease accessory protein UreF n=1 Tax=Asanoa sp. NPDC050611 TaxID=3157098 RepID=UPI0033D88DAD